MAAAPDGNTGELQLARQRGRRNVEAVGDPRSSHLLVPGDEVVDLGVGGASLYLNKVM